MDDRILRAFVNDRRRTTRRLTEVVEDIRRQLEQVEEAVAIGKPLAASRMWQVVSLAGDAALAAGALDTLVEWGEVFTSQSAAEGGPADASR